MKQYAFKSKIGIFPEYNQLEFKPQILLGHILWAGAPNWQNRFLFPIETIRILVYKPTLIFRLATYKIDVINPYIVLTPILY